jgi:hypothetical protein
MPGSPFSPPRICSTTNISPPHKFMINGGGQ